ncbi:MAG: class I SAM-dependent methyltransferase [Chloroflexi bacterium]|nr:class I SAM-dependent methyltransferase [Chloroflexota bacterium]
MSTYGDAWADLYDAVHSQTEDIAFWVEEAQACGGPVLELASGTGRVTLPIAQAGAPVVGLDSSLRMLRIARAKARRLKLAPDRLRFVRGDMRRFSLGRQFSLAIIPFRSFQMLLSVADQSQALACIKEHLAPEGRLIIDLFVPDVERILREPGVRVYGRERVDPATGHRLLLGEQNSYDTFNQVISARSIIEELDGEGVLVRTAHVEYQLRYIYRFEMGHLLAACGYQVQEVYGGFARQELDEESTEMIWVATPQS